MKSYQYCIDVFGLSQPADAAMAREKLDNSTFGDQIIQVVEARRKVDQRSSSYGPPGTIQNCMACG